MLGMSEWSTLIGSERQWGSLTNHPLEFGYLPCHSFRLQICGTGQEVSQNLYLAQDEDELWHLWPSGSIPEGEQIGLHPRAPQGRPASPSTNCTGSVLFPLAPGEVPPEFLAITRVRLPPMQRPTESSVLMLRQAPRARVAGQALVLLPGPALGSPAPEGW